MQSQDASPALTLDPSQREALALILTEPFGIVTGGPGTGKTTILKEALLALGGQSVALAAPTGKAAKRMEEVTGASAQTIHRLLQWSPLTQAFRFCEDEPLGFDVVIVDEASMIDVLLFDSLLSAIHPSRTRLILMGDANQLPSVGPGAILGDLVRCGQVPCARLTQVHRSAADSWICSMAPRVLSGAELDMTKRTDFEFVSCESNMDVASACADLYETTRAQILVPQRTGVAGADAINLAIQGRFNPLAPNEIAWPMKPHDLRVGDWVIHTRNNYELGVFNGECGEVWEINAKEGLVTVRFDDRSAPVQYSGADAFDLRLAYALTIHKAQGSEWPTVIVVVHNTHTYMLTRQLLYTAITRAKKNVFIVGNEAGIRNALSSRRNTKRNTMLEKLLH